jgi:hypothetical protein
LHRHVVAGVTYVSDGLLDRKQNTHASRRRQVKIHVAKLNVLSAFFILLTVVHACAHAAGDPKELARGMTTSCFSSSGGRLDKNNPNL